MSESKYRERITSPHIDENDVIASANEWTGSIPAIPLDDDTQNVRKMMDIDPQPERHKHKKDCRSH